MRKKAIIVDYDKIDQQLSKLKNKKKVIVGGCFDVLHLGHIRFLNQASQLGNCLIVFLESDDFIKQRKKRQPIHHQDQRAEILASISSVDIVVKLPLLTNNKQYLNLLKLIKPQVIAITDGDVKKEVKKTQADQIKSQLAVVNKLIVDLSTQKILDKFNI